MNSSPKLRKRAAIAACTPASAFLSSHQLIQRYKTIAEVIQDTVGYLHTALLHSTLTTSCPAPPGLPILPPAARSI